MLKHIIEFSVKNKLIIGLMVIALISYGLYQATLLPIDAVPDITDNQVQVITIAPSFGATDIERLVTFPIEQANSNIPGIKEIRSFSRFGLSLVTIVFTDETDIYLARQQVSERLQQVQAVIPKGIGSPELGPVTTGLGEIFQYVIKPAKGYEDQYDATDLRTIQDWIVRRQLLGVDGVAEVSSFGGKLKQYEIAINPDKLNAHQLTIDDVYKAIEDNNQNTGGSYIEKGPTVLYIRSEGLIGSSEEILDIAIPTDKSASPIFIRDIATVNIGHATRYGALCYNDEGEVAGAIVMMLKGANSSKVINNVKDRIAQIQKTLPKGVEIEPFLDRTKMVNNAISTVETNLIEGALIVIFVLVLFLGNFRAGLLVASVIPLAMLFAIIMMNIFGVSGNLMSLGALDFGLIVDGAVIIVEAVMHQLAHGHKYKNLLSLSKSEMDNTVTESASRMMNSAVFGQIIILIVYLPIFTLQGIEGKMFKPMAQTVVFALIGAFILSLTYIPMMSAFFLSKKVKHKPNISDKAIHKIEEFYGHVLSRVLRIPKTLIALVIGLFILAIFTLSKMGGEFIPALEEGDFAVDTRVLTGSNLQTTIDFTQKAAHILKTNFPEVIKVVTKIGSGEVPTDPMPMEASDMMVILKDKKEWTSAHTFDELAEKMSVALQDVPGITAGFQYPVQMRFNELMTGARQDVVCKIFGENLDSLAAYADKLGNVVSAVDGAENLYIEPIGGMPQVIIDYKRNMIAQYKLSIADVNRIVNTAFAGQSAGMVFEEEKHFELVVKLANTERKNIEDIRNLLIPTPLGIQVPLSLIANVDIVEGPNQIQREDAKRRIVVGFNVRGRDVQSIVNELKSKVEDSIQFSPGYFVTYGGAFENLLQAKNRLMVAVPVSLLLIFVLLFFAFNSIKHGLLIYSAIPLSAIGGIFSLYFRDMPFSISAGVGFIALFGVAVLNGIVLIAEFNRLKKQGDHGLREIVIIGTKMRLRPVLMTGFVASLGFLPMALSNGSGAEVQRPLATVVIGGLLVATFLTLFVLPVLYIAFEKGIKLKPVRNKKHLLIVLLLSSSGMLYAQEKLTLSEAIQRASTRNLQLQDQRKYADYSQALISSAKQIPLTNFLVDLGQVNSRYFDTKVAAEQRILLPAVHNSQKKLYTAEWKQALLTIEMEQYKIAKLITQLYYDYAYLKSKEDYLMEIDSLYASSLQKAELRLQKGETNILEKSAILSQKESVQLQVVSIKEQLKILISGLEWLTNSDVPLIPIIDKDIDNPAIKYDSLLLANHPSMLSLVQQAEIAKAVVDVERSKLKPELSIGYSNNSFSGYSDNDKYYNNLNRFSSVQLGMGIPLFKKGQKAKIKAISLLPEIYTSQYSTQESLLKNRFSQLMEVYNAGLARIAYYENQGLKNADVIRSTAQKQFSIGEINYIEYVWLLSQSLQSYSDYLEAKRLLHNAIIDINYLMP